MISCPYPAGSGYTEADWSILAGFWHPVATAAEVTASRPFAARLLDVNLVLYRIDGLTAALDHCPHRGTRLSMGRITDGSLVCPYHGLEFDGRGVCTRIPGDAHTTRVPARFRIPTFQVEERYGLVWVCLADAAACPLPDWSTIEREGNQRAILQATWNTSAPRHVENFNDVAHFATAHAGTFGCAERPVVQDYAVESRPHGLFFEVNVPMIDGSTFGHREYQDVRSEYHVAFPFATRLTLHYSRGIEHICDVASPISPGRTRIFLLKSRDHDQHESLADWVRFQEAVNEEDREMVESQTPVRLPLERAAEWQLASDRFSILYRRYWLGLGMETVL